MLVQKLTSAIIFIVFFSSCNSISQEINVPKLEEIKSIDDIVKPYLENETTDVLSMATFSNNEWKFYNYRNELSKSKTAPTDNTIYEIGSVTKTFTSLILSQLVEEGIVNLDDPITKFLPSKTVDWSDDENITLLELATHSSGLPRLASNMKMKAFTNLSNPYAKYTIQDTYTALSKHKPIIKKDREIEYSNFGTGLLGHIFELIEQKSYEEILKERIFDPLQMYDTYVNDGSGRNTIQGYDDFGEKTPNWDIPFLPGMGGIRSSTADMTKYIEANINGVLSTKATHKTYFPMNERQNICLSWINQLTKSGENIFWHNGGTGGFRSFVGFNKENEMAVIVFGNSTISVDLVGIRTMEVMKRDGI